MPEQNRFGEDDARRIGEEIGIDWSSAPFDVDQFRRGMDVELEHGLHDLMTNVTDDDPIVTMELLPVSPEQVQPALARARPSTA